ncbi:MAG: D-alanyl-D-alanine carboxypeptidase/D-alanyl-D-alanine-endopeptidase [Nitrosomonas sp.]|nr:MAG: D-alanyl-D-alanine carboxypeptidase/D-alanyl-D-alanine-endopeptidase [Nitrosomonas sp.]
MIRFFLYLGLSVLLIAQSALTLAHELPPAVKQKLQKLAIPESAIGIYVQEIGASQPMIAINADTAMNPASVMKLLTTFAGLELLGPSFTWPTILYANGKLIDGVLHGDLIIKGYGDPKLDLENFWLLIHRLRHTGLDEIKGNLILDHSHYDIPRGDPGEFDGQPYRTYNTLPEALLVNYRTSTIHFIPQPEKDSIRVIVDPLPESLHIQNNLRLTQGTCGDWQNLLSIEAFADKDSDKQFTIALNGSFSKRCGKQSYMLSLHDSAVYTRDLFKLLWRQHGGLFHGDVTEGVAPPGLVPLKTYYSPSLADIVRGINKFSNNIAARQLYLTLGTTSAGDNNISPATLAKSDAAVRQWLESKQLKFPELIIENGSGLSRKEQISARHMGQLLLAAFNSAVMPEFISSLPIAAVDGTLKNRFIDSPVKGLAHMKTGALNNVRALAGYLLDHKGRRVVVVFFVNHDKAGQSRSAMDTLVQWVYSRP